MRIFLFIAAVFFGSGQLRAQEIEIDDNVRRPISFAGQEESPSGDAEKPVDSPGKAPEKPNRPAVTFFASKPQKPLFASPELERNLKDKAIEPKMPEYVAPAKSAPPEKTRERFHWKPALIQSGIFLGIQHAYRMTQGRTRRELGGPFFRDWITSVKGLRGWDDPDNFFINYVLHPLQGGLTGRIFVVNSDRAKRQQFGRSKDYWKSRFNALIWSTVWSTQFELGPFSEASLGNVGLREKRGRSTMAYVDLVVTPIAGTGVLIVEDAIDKYILKKWVERNARKTNLKIRILRSILTPTTSISNLLRGKVPWKRDNRSLRSP